MAFLYGFLFAFIRSDFLSAVDISKMLAQTVTIATEGVLLSTELLCSPVTQP